MSFQVVLLVPACSGSQVGREAVRRVGQQVTWFSPATLHDLQPHGRTKPLCRVQVLRQG